MRAILMESLHQMLRPSNPRRATYAYSAGRSNFAVSKVAVPAGRANIGATKGVRATQKVSGTY